MLSINDEISALTLWLEATDRYLAADFKTPGIFSTFAEATVAACETLQLRGNKELREAFDHVKREVTAHPGDNLILTLEKTLLDRDKPFYEVIAHRPWCSSATLFSRATEASLITEGRTTTKIHEIWHKVHEQQRQLGLRSQHIPS